MIHNNLIFRSINPYTVELNGQFTQLFLHYFPSKSDSFVVWNTVIKMVLSIRRITLLTRVKQNLYKVPLLYFFRSYLSCNVAVCQCLRAAKFQRCHFSDTEFLNEPFQTLRKKEVMLQWENVSFWTLGVCKLIGDKSVTFKMT